ncbi:RrF2 family transcriptional regulator [Dongia rigui]|uniref:Rrf2 family transcriptional regulator n=1 Tax=Dongia rigui TaxID=940149 RepID=A0ABU5DZ39_9PROT|nr:Rrf2 family transcriptional regulator [Dongia rigui]MDY0871816.1 Rrf2 family transcriptional regulator [Dongia rigui]
MLHPSKRLLFAIEAVLDIAYYGGSQPVQSGDISTRQGIPRRYLEQVLQHLVRSGILAGHRGPKGGYLLAREKRRINLGEIVRAVRQFEGSPDPVQTASGSRVALEIVRPVWRELQQEMLSKLDDVTLEDLCQKAQAAGIQTDALQRLDFSI